MSKEWWENRGCCRWCVEHFSNNNSKHTPFSDEFLCGEADASKAAGANACSACVGICALIFSQAWQQQIADQIRTSGFELNGFDLGISMPANVFVRNHALWTAYAREFPTAVMIELKTTLKRAVEHFVLQKLVDQDLLSSIPKTECELPPVRLLLAVLHADSLNEYPELCAHSTARANTNRPRRFKRQKQHTDSNDRDGNGKDAGNGVAGEGPSVNAFNSLVSTLTQAELEAKGLLSIPPLADSSPAPTATLTISRDPVYVVGNYVKLSREFSQSPWMLTTTSSSPSNDVSSSLALPIQSALGAPNHTFFSSGREDVDVRMLPPGRPFGLQFLDSHRVFLTQETLAGIAEEVERSSRGAVKALKLRMGSPAEVREVKSGAESHTKRYACVVILPRPLTEADENKLNALRNVLVTQKTPLRVLHRRSQLVRTKTLIQSVVRRVSSHSFVWEVDVSAGTYVKELVHGDFGRTSPSVAQLLECEADIVQLDVLCLNESPATATTAATGENVQASHSE